MENFLDVSVVIPVFNEKESLKELSSKLVNVLERIGTNYEVLFVDDGSTDGSFDFIKEINEKNHSIRGVQLRKNFGKAVALSTGFQRARGKIIVTMDGDLQDEPEEIPKFLQKIKEEYDLISGWKQKRNDHFFRVISSKIFNKMTALFTGVRLHDINCGFKCYRREVLEQINIYGELYRYIPILVAGRGFRVSEIPVEHHYRRFGKSKYGPGRFIKGCLDLLTILFLTRYKERPLHFFGISGIIVSGTGFGICIYMSFLRFQGYKIGDRPLLLLGILMLILGVQFVSIGLIGEMIAARFVKESNKDIIISEI